MAVAARGGPEFDDYRNVIEGDGAFKIGRVKIDRAGDEQFPLASSALRPITQSRVLHSVDRITMWTNDFQGLFHDSLHRLGLGGSAVSIITIIYEINISYYSMTKPGLSRKRPSLPTPSFSH